MNLSSNTIIKIGSLIWEDKRLKKTTRWMAVDNFGSSGYRDVLPCLA